MLASSKFSMYDLNEEAVALSPLAFIVTADSKLLETLVSKPPSYKITNGVETYVYVLSLTVWISLGEPSP